MEHWEVLPHSATPHFRWRHPRALFINTLLERSKQAFYGALRSGVVFKFPMEGLLSFVLPPHMIRHFDIVLLLAQALGALLFDRKTRYHVLYTPYLWWCRYGSREKAVFAVLWYHASCVVPYLVGTWAWRCLHSWLWRPGVGFWVGTLLWAVELVIVNLAGSSPTLLDRSSSLDDQHQLSQEESSQLSPVYGEYQNYIRRINLQTAMASGDHRPAGLPDFYFTRRLAPGEIRLIRVKPVSSSSEVEIELWTETLREDLEYTAISYVWGNPDKTHGLQVDGKWLAVPASTFEVLHQQAAWWTGRSDRYFWIDSICINQQDKFEKAAQITIMKEIYAKANEVVSYLRPDDHEEADIAVFFFRSLMSDIYNRRKGRYGVLGIGRDRKSYSMITAALMGVWSGATGSLPSPGWEALSKLFAHEYWTRMWILQELVLAPAPNGLRFPSRGLRIFYGEHELCWEELHAFANITAPLSGFVNMDYSNVVSGEDITRSHHRVQKVFDYRYIYHKKVDGASLELPELLTTCRNMQASVATDRIFALVGLLPEVPPELKPDYINNTTEELYIKVARFCIQKVDPEWLLTMAGTGYWPDKLVGTSWVPDWTNRHPVPFLHMRDRTKEMSDRSVRLLGQALDNSASCLRLRSRQIGVVRKTVSIDGLFEIPPLATADTLSLNWFGAIAGVVELADELSKAQVADEPTIDALGQVLTGGMGHPAAFRVLFADWRRIMTLIKDGRINLGAGVLDLPERLQQIMTMWGISRVPEAEEVGELGRWTTVCSLRCLASIGHGHFALVPRLTREQDEVHTIDGADSRFVLRPASVSIEGVPRFELVGDCFPRGIGESTQLRESVAMDVEVQ